MTDELPNYYDVNIQAEECFPKSGFVSRYPYTLSAKSVEAQNEETAVAQVLRKNWHEDCQWFPSEGEPGWVVCGPDDADDDPWLEIPVEELGDCAQPVPYERRLRLAGIRPMEFV